MFTVYKLEIINVMTTNIEIHVITKFSIFSIMPNFSKLNIRSIILLLQYLHFSISLFTYILLCEKKNDLVL